jgi:ribosomal protein L24
MQRAAGQEALKQLTRNPTNPQAVLESLHARTAYKRKYQKKKYQKSVIAAAHDDVRNEENQLRYANKIRGLIVKSARVHRHEDWQMGPLAPKRDIGLEAGVQFASVPGAFIEPPAMTEKAKWVKKNRKAEEKQGLKNGDLVRKYELYDRVVVIKGREKGKIGTVKKISEDSGMIWVREVNTVSHTSYAHAHYLKTSIIKQQMPGRLRPVRLAETRRERPPTSPPVRCRDPNRQCPSCAHNA